MDSCMSMKQQCDIY